MPGKSFTGQTRAKCDRENRKRARRESKRSGKPAGELGTVLPKPKRRRQWVELERIGGGWLPDFTVKGLAELRAEGRTSFGPYTFVRDHSRSTETLIFCEGYLGADLTSRRRDHLGTFLIDLQKKTKQRVEDKVPREYSERLEEERFQMKKHKAVGKRAGGIKPFKLRYTGNRNPPPEITPEVWNRIARLQDAKSGQLTFTVDKQKSRQGEVVVTIEAGIHTKRKLGKYRIYVTDKYAVDF